MRSHEDGRTAGIDFLENAEDFFSVFRVQVTGRFVRQKQVRIVHHRTGNRHALLFTARKRVRHRKALLANAHERKRVKNSRVNLVARSPHNAQRKRHIFKNIAVRQQLKVLENNSHLAAERLDPIVWSVLAIVQDVVRELDHHLAAAFFVRTLIHVDEFQHRRLSGAGMPRQENKLALVDAEGDVVQRLPVGFVRFRDVGKMDHIIPSF